MIHIAEDSASNILPENFYPLRSTIYSYSNDERPLLDSMGSSQEPPLDEIQWRSPQIAQSMTGIQTNTGSDSLCLQSLF